MYILLLQLFKNSPSVLSCLFPLPWHNSMHDFQWHILNTLILVTAIINAKLYLPVDNYPITRIIVLKCYFCQIALLLKTNKTYQCLSFICKRKSKSSNASTGIQDFPKSSSDLFSNFSFQNSSASLLITFFLIGLFSLFHPTAQFYFLYEVHSDYSNPL